MKLIQICSYYINDKLYENFFLELNKINVFSKAYVFANLNRKKENINLNGAVVSYCFNSFDRGIFYLKHKKVYKDFLRLINVKDYDCIHAHSLFSNGYIAYKAKKKYHIPYVVTIRYPDILTFFKWLIYLRPIGNKILLNANGIIFLSESSKKSLNQYLNENVKNNIQNKSFIIPNGIDEFWIKNTIDYPKKFDKNNTLKLIYAGKINSNKNPESLIKISQKLIQQGINVELKIIGQIQKKKYHILFKKYDFIKYYPFCTKEELLKYYRNSDIFIMLSKKETFGLVYAEAMTQGLPVIYTKGQGFDGQFDDGEIGYSCEYNNIDKAVDLIKNILEDYSSISARCIQNSLKYSWYRIAADVKKVYIKSINVGRNL